MNDLDPEMFAPPMPLVPQRIQLSRRKGFRLPLTARGVARPSRWGNPFTTEQARDIGYALSEADARRFVVEVFRDWLTRGPRSKWWFTDGADRHAYMTAHLPDLAGVDLACYCPLDVACHADVLIELANQGESS